MPALPLLSARCCSSDAGGGPEPAGLHSEKAAIEIVLDQVSKRYPTMVGAALENVSLKLSPGEWVFLVGASGAGKTTLLKLLYKEEIPDSGEIVMDGRNIAGVRGSSLRRSLGIVFQSFRLLEKKGAFENIAYAAEVLALPPDEVRRRTREVLELVGLGDKAERLPKELSGGEQQRVAIGRALINRPKLILADEPTGDLDPDNVDRIIEILERVNRETKTTILFATHAANVVNRLSKRVVRLDAGRIVSDAASGYWSGDEARSV